MAYSPEQLSDMQCIRDAALRYCRGVDRLNVELMKSAYWEGATDDHGVFVGDASTLRDTDKTAVLVTLPTALTALVVEPHISARGRRFFRVSAARGRKGSASKVGRAAHSSPSQTGRCSPWRPRPRWATRDERSLVSFAPTDLW